MKMVMPPLAPFLFGRPFTPFRGEFSSSGEPLSVLNSEKLSLSPSTPVGTEVSVSDGFVVSGATINANGEEQDGLYVDSGLTNSGKKVYQRAIDVSPGIHNYVGYTGANWQLNTAAAIDSDQGGNSAVGSETNPWDADWSGDAITLAHPAVQVLVAPSTVQGGVFVSGGTQDGVYTPRNAFSYGNLLGQPDSEDAYCIHDGPGGESNPLIKWRIADGDSTMVYYSLSDVATPDLAGTDKFVMAVSGVAYSQRGTFNGKPYFNKIGQSTSTALNAIFWSSATWHISNALGVDLDTSTSAVATPDLATFLLGTVVTNTAWLNASDDSPASITVTSVSVGELNAGLRKSVDTFIVNGSLNGRSVFTDILGVAADINWNPDDLAWETDSFGTLINSGNVAFPFQGTPEATVTRNDVASEANWANV